MRCPSCHRNVDRSAERCPACWGPLLPGTYADAEPVEEPMAFRPAGTPAFSPLRVVVLRRLSVDGPPVYALPDGRLEANLVAGPGPDGRPRVTCVDLDGSDLFVLERYDPAARSYAAFVPDGGPLAAFVARDGLDPGIDVRDGASAPVARLSPVPGQPDSFDLTETGGGRLASVWREDQELGDWLDDRWHLLVAAEDGPLPHRALAALLLVCRLRFGRPARRRPREDGADEGGIALAGGLLGLFFDRP